MTRLSPLYFVPLNQSLQILGATKLEPLFSITLKQCIHQSLELNFDHFANWHFIVNTIGSITWFEVKHGAFDFDPSHSIPTSRLSLQIS